MTLPPTGGLWSTPRGLWLVVLNGSRPQAPLRILRSDEGRQVGLEQLAEVQGLELVMPEMQRAVDPFAELALGRGVPVWLVPELLLDALRRAAGLHTGPPARTAALLARLPHVAMLRPSLRRMTLEPDPCQLSML